MKAILLAAGLGTRLRPITNTVPKCLVPINGKPLLEYWLENLTNIGINEFLINTHYFHTQVEEYVNKSRFKDNITLIYEEKLLNTGGTVLKSKRFLNNEPFLLIHADNLCFCNFKKFIKTYETRPINCQITMMLFKTDTPKNCGIVKLNEKGIVQAFYEKVERPPSNLANAAVYICTPSIIEFLENLNKTYIDFSNDVLPKFINRMNTFLNDTYHRDIGTIESYALAQIEIKEYI